MRNAWWETINMLRVTSVRLAIYSLACGSPFDLMTLCPVVQNWRGFSY